MKKVKRIALALVCVLAVGIFAGCGNKFDAQAYLKAMLDVSYKNDSTGFVEMKLGTAEEAAEIYNQGIELWLNHWRTDIGFSGELEDDFRQIIKDMLSNVRYTVDSAEEEDSQTWVVTITYEKMNVYDDYTNSCLEAYTDKLVEWQSAAEILNEEEIMDELIVMLKDCMKNAVANAEFSEPATTIVRIELIDNVWTPNTRDIENLEKALFDTAE